MSITQTQRVSLHANLVDLMGQQDAEALVEMLPPGGWENVATKDDLKNLETTLTAAITETNATITAGLAETNATITAGLAETNAALTAGLAKTNATITETNAAITAGLAKTNAALTAGLAKTNATITETNAAITETNAAITAGLAETNAAIAAGLAEATKERAQLAVDLAKDARREAKNLYITVSTIVLATISIWIALLASMPSGG